MANAFVYRNCIKPHSLHTLKVTNGVFYLWKKLSKNLTQNKNLPEEL